MDKGMILAFVFSTIGASKGFVWEWGPVIWGLIGGAFGFVIGVILSWIIYLIKREKNQAQIRKGNRGEVILIVQCEDSKVSVVEDILWDHKALGLAITK
ncbi:hypothetical protein ACFQ88_17260 [Paenibacillus sp. NPDC056579]